jgi:hypothetical protein
LRSAQIDAAAHVHGFLSRDGMATAHRIVMAADERQRLTAALVSR